jgi:hypothetical protein
LGAVPGQLLPGVSQFAVTIERDSPGGVEAGIDHRPHLGGPGQRKLIVLTDDLDADQFGRKDLGRRYRAVEVGPAATAPLQPADGNRLGDTVDEPALDRRLFREGADEFGPPIGPDEQAHRAQQKRLPRPGLACHHGQAGRGVDRRLLDDAEVADHEFIDHELSRNFCLTVAGKDEGLRVRKRTERSSQTTST